MFIFLIKNDYIRSFSLPSQCYGIYWVTTITESGEEKPLISIEAHDGKWQFNSNADASIIENKLEIQSKVLEEYKFYNIYNKQTKKFEMLYCTPMYDKTFTRYYVNKTNIIIGKDPISDIQIINPSVDSRQAEITIEKDKCILYNFSNKTGVYVNNNRLLNGIELKSSDTIFTCGVRIVVIFENDKIMLMINNPKGCVRINDIYLTKIDEKKINDNYNELTDDEAVVYKDDQYFNKRPRFKENIEELNIAIDTPPAKEQKSDMPAILKYGPMITSAAITLIYGYMTISNLIRYGNNWSTAWPSFAVCILSLMATLVWPLIISKYTKYKSKKIEKNRIEKYNKYIKNINQQINDNANKQKQILIANSPSLEECKKSIETRNMNFWNRRVEDDDFLTVSLGYGEMPMKINLKVPEVHFSLDEDELLTNTSKMKDNLPVLSNVPIVYNFYDKKVTATIGDYKLNKSFVDRIIFQLAALHSYDDLKIVVLTSEFHDNQKDWDYIKILPHSWNTEKDIRFYGINKDSIREICYYLDNKLTQRLENKNNKKDSNLPFYLIITDNYKIVRNFDFIKRFIETDENVGFGLLIINDRIFDLPPECDAFINVNQNQSEVFKNILNADVQKFVIDFKTKIDMFKYCQIMANIPIMINNNSGSLTDKIGFLELYEVGKIEQLNVLNRWKESNPMLSLQALIGLGKGGEKIYLDLHEKFHGPHGLIAGMTGSGKTEFIATYILSLAINYHPNEVQFILIDYKGGGLTGIFENNITGVKLPHLIGTITNLDDNEINRALASIESELKRRQRVFGQVREQLGDSVIDIYKYQQLYRNGVIKEPISHLFIISDEFAELKSQQPEFLQQLISISRIGRSLGIHLILATQKPSGVVDNQIWSNSKFRVCLRVQEKSDSTEVIKCPDAALLKNAGRFYLQVGYNEVFVLGQAAWGGGNYIPRDKVKKKNENYIDFIDNIGYSLKKIDMDKKNETNVNYGEEIKNIVQYLNQLAMDEGIKNNNLWLDKIPDYINIDELKKKYDYIKEDYHLDVPIGEYDIPFRQSQELLTIPFCEEGNALVYGSTGSGKENFIMTLLYSAITDFTTNELICYIIDCGTQSLKSFSGIPQIGDVIEADNTEKVTNLYKFLYFMLDERKNLFENFNGDYNLYCQKSDSKVPSVLVIINNYDSYIEQYSSFDETLIQLTREGTKFGIYFVITVSNSNLIRTKLQQNFKLTYILQQNNISDYTNILGNVNKKYPSKIFGRGIIKKDDIYEFQTAMISDKNRISEVIEQIKEILNSTNRLSAIKIPTLPRTVSKDDIQAKITKDGMAIIGVEKESLNIAKYDLKNNYMNLFLSFDISNMSMFLNPFISQILFTDYFDLIVINAENISVNQGAYTYYDNGFDDIIDKIKEYVNNNHQLYEENNFDKSIIKVDKIYLCIIIGFDSLKNKLNMQNKNDIGNIFETGKDLGVINYIIVDSIDKIKKYEYDSWYKTVVNNTRGIFFGNGMMDQMF